MLQILFSDQFVFPRLHVIKQTRHFLILIRGPRAVERNVYLCVCAPGDVQYIYLQTCQANFEEVFSVGILFFSHIFLNKTQQGPKVFFEMFSQA